MTSAIATRRLSKRFALKRGWFAPRQFLHAVREVTLSVQAGETLGIVGESGCGKSTLAKMLTGLLPASSGEIILFGQPLAAARRREAGKKIQYIFQDAISSLNPRKTVSESLQAPLVHLHALPTAQRLQRVREMLALVNLREECLSRYPHAFSGGQAQRIGICRALLATPKILVLDEPVSALDVSVQAQVLNLLETLKERLSLTYLLISHDLAVVESVSDRVAVMYCGEIVEMGAAQRIFSRPRHPYTQLLADSAPVIGKKNREMAAAELPDIINPPKGCPFAPRCRKAVAHCRAHKPVLQQQQEEHHVACHFPG